jgi:hypothetical protein
VFQLRTYRCCAADYATGHFQTHALQQSRGSVEIAGQAFSSSSNAFASFRSRVSNPSVNQP